jgi:uncharacterized protein involved in exopolysaccharide biosynthesis
MDDATSTIYSAFLVEEEGASTFRGLLEAFIATSSGSSNRPQEEGQKTGQLVCYLTRTAPVLTTLVGQFPLPKSVGSDRIERMEVIAILDVLRRHVILIVALCIVTTLAGYGISFLQPLIPEKYEVSAIVLVRPNEPIKITAGSTGKEYLDFPVGGTPVVESASKTYIRIIESPALISQVVRQLGLDKPRPKKACAGDTMFGLIAACLKALYDEVEPYIKDSVALVKYGRVLRDDPFTKAVKDVTSNLLLKSYEDTYIVEIQYGDEEPERAAEVANTLARLFIEFLNVMQSSEAKESASRLKKEFEQSLQQLVDARERLGEYKASHRVFQTQSEYAEKLKVIGDLTFELAKLDSSLAKLDASTPQPPSRSASRSDASDAHDSAAAGTIEDNSNAMKRTRLRKILAEKQAELASLPMIERDLQQRQTDVDVANTAYGIVAEALKDAELKSDALPEARLISPALVPQLPSKPRRVIFLGVAALTGLLVGVALAFFLEHINRTARRIDDIEDFVGLKVIGTIPLARPHHGGL